MALKKTLMIVGAAASVGLAGAAAGVNAVSAEAGEHSGPLGLGGLVDKIAGRFDLDESEVQAVFDEHREEMHASHQARLEERLDEAVEAGELTEDQKNRILAKLEEIKQQHETSREDFKDMTREERHEAMKQKRDDLKKWAEENNIPEEYFRLPGRGHHGPAFTED